MALRFTVRSILPSMLIYAALIALAIAFDWILHVLGWARVGRYLGAIGSSVIIASFAYSLRKRRYIEHGSPKRLLQSHELMGWLGALMVLVHGGAHFNAILPWMALVSMMVVVASGLTGKFLLQDARASLKVRALDLKAAGHSADDIEKELLGLGLIAETMQQWRRVHLPLTMVFVGLALIHIAATVLLWRW